MKNSFGTSVIITIFGESHGPYIGAVLDGMAPGIEIDEEYIGKILQARAPKDCLSTSRREEDRFSIVSGVRNGFTTGTPVTILIPNRDTRSSDYEQINDLARPGHADFAAQCKYHGFQDKRGGGHFSGRVTAALTAAGAVCLSALEKKGIVIGTHISRCAGVDDRPFEDIYEDIKILSAREFPVLSDESGEKIRERIIEAREKQDSVGGILTTAVAGIPEGVGEPWFDSVESELAHALFSIPAVKGIEFGKGFAMADMKGSEANDQIEMKNGRAVHTTNNNGGINGGITNGMPVVFSCVVKPTPSIGIKQNTVNIRTGENETIEISGRHDPAVVHRAAAVVNALTAVVVCDMLAQRFGTDYLTTRGDS